MSSYPSAERQGKFFGLKFCKLLSKTAAANEIGADAVVLLMVVALKEDSKEYTAAPDYWNHQLMPLCGIASPKRLVKARNRAVEAGWLHYEQGGKGKVGRYWVLVPDGFQELWGKRSGADLSFRNGSQNGKTNQEAGVCRSDTEGKTAPKRKSKRRTSIPVPKPEPKGKRFSYPKDFKAFWKAYPAGRKTDKKDAYKAWKDTGADPAVIIAAATEYAASDVGRGEYVKGPATWLRKGCWDDDRAAWSNQTNKPKSQYENLG